MANSLSPDGLTVNAINGGQVGGNRNLIINGACVIDQRNNGSAVSATAGTVGFFADRWKSDIAGGVNGVFSAQQQTSVVPTGFKYATKLTVTTAHTTAGTAHYYRYYYAGIEGYDASHLEFGNSNAKTVTLSFYVRSSVTGTYCVGLQNASANRSYAAEYSISSANTWERKEVTIALDQSGTWNDTNGIGVRIFWDLGSGSNWNMTADTWAATNTWKTSNQTAWITNASATLYITGVQLEVGSTATEFEHRSFGDELRRCQRYYHILDHAAGSGYASASGQVARCLTTVEHPTTMRASPTFSTANISFTVSNNVDTGTGVEATYGATNTSAILRMTSSGSGSLNWAVTGDLIFDAEL